MDISNVTKVYLLFFSPKTGADHHSVFTNKDVGEKDIVGDSGLRGQLRMPKDLCVALTEESSGSVFNRCVSNSIGADYV